MPQPRSSWSAIEVPKTTASSTKRIVKPGTFSSNDVTVLRDALVHVAGKPLAQAVRDLITVMIDAHRVDPQLHRVLVEQIPRTGTLTEVEGFDRESHALVRAYFEVHKKELRPIDLDLAAFVCVASVESLTHGAVLHYPQLLARGKVESFVDEVTRLVVRYLQ